MNDLHREGEGWEAIADGWAERVRTGTDQARQWVLDPPHLAIAGEVAGVACWTAGAAKAGLHACSRSVAPKSRRSTSRSG